MMHLRSLQEDELKPLHPLLKSLADHSEHVVERWYQLYASRGGEDKALPQEEFSGIMSPLLRSGAAALLNSDFEHFGALGRALGEQLATRGIPFFEVVLSLHLCQESIETLYAEEMPLPLESLFAQLCHLHATLDSRRLYPDRASQFICRSRSARRRRRPAANRGSKKFPRAAWRELRDAADLRPGRGSRQGAGDGADRRRERHG